MYTKIAKCVLSAAKCKLIQIILSHGNDYSSYIIILARQDGFNLLRKKKTKTDRNCCFDHLDEPEQSSFETGGLRSSSSLHVGPCSCCFLWHKLHNKSLNQLRSLLSAAAIHSVCSSVSDSCHSFVLPAAPSVSRLAIAGSAIDRGEA